jgi:hypothetical protein
MDRNDFDDDEGLSPDDRIAMIRDIARRIQQGNRKTGTLHLLKPEPADEWDERDD